MPRPTPTRGMILPLALTPKGARPQRIGNGPVTAFGALLDACDRYGLRAALVVQRRGSNAVALGFSGRNVREARRAAAMMHAVAASPYTDPAAWEEEPDPAPRKAPPPNKARRA